MIKVVITGAECTGKSLLTKELSQYFNAPHSEEFVRIFLDSKNEPIKRSDLESIINGQLEVEKKACYKNPPIVFHDTNLISNYVYIEHYFNIKMNYLNDLIERESYNLYLYCEDDFPWVKDGIQRDSETARRILNKKFKNEFKSRNIDLIELKGDLSMRLNNSVKIIQSLYYNF